MAILFLTEGQKEFIEERTVFSTTGARTIGCPYAK